MTHAVRLEEVTCSSAEFEKYNSLENLKTWFTA
jgi:hypothetical protein